MIKSELTQEFFNFLKKFGVIGLAIGVIVGDAATKIVTSLVTNIITPLVGLLPSLDSLSRLNVILKDGKTFEIAAQAGDNDKLISNIGIFTTDAINFIVLMLVVFFSVKLIINRFLSDEEKGHTKM
jgi:large conductance mechanosensitive channel